MMGWFDDHPFWALMALIGTIGGGPVLVIVILIGAGVIEPMELHCPPGARIMEYGSVKMRHTVCAREVKPLQE